MTVVDLIDATPLAAAASAIADQLDRIHRAFDLEELETVRANVEAARAWAKVRGLAEESRQALLAVEVEALARIAELGHVEVLPSNLRKAAAFLAEMTVDERATVVRNTTNEQTMAAVWRNYLSAMRDERERLAGNKWAIRPSGGVSKLRVDPTEVAKLILEDFAETGEDFTVENFADRLSGAVEDPPSPGFRQGVAEMCRWIIRNADEDTIDGTPVPKFVTARTPEGGYLRVPTQSATVAQVLDNLAMKDTQVDQMCAARDRFKRFADVVVGLAGGDNTAHVADLLAAALSPQNS